MAKGGARPGAGRPVGQTSMKFREALIKFLEEPEMQAMYFAKLKEKIQQGDTKLLTWIGDQTAGRAPQHLDLGGNLDLTTYIIKRGETVDRKD